MFRTPPHLPPPLPWDHLNFSFLKSYKQLQLSYFCVLCGYIQYDNIHWITASSIARHWEPLSILQLSNQRCWVDTRIGCLGSTEDLPAGHSKWPLQRHTWRRQLQPTNDHLITICVLQSRDRTSPNPTLVCSTVKPLIIDPLKNRQPLYSGWLTCSRWFYHRTNTFRTSEKRTLLNSEQWTLISPWRNLANIKITSENGQWSYTHIMRTLVDCFRNATVAGFKDRALH